MGEEMPKFFDVNARNITPKTGDRNRLRITLLLFFGLGSILFAYSGSFAFAQAPNAFRDEVIVSGEVRDLISDIPIQGASIRVDGQTERSDALGRYELRLRPGRYNIRFEADGFGGASFVDVEIARPNADLGSGSNRESESEPASQAIPIMHLPGVDPSEAEYRYAMQRMRKVRSIDIGRPAIDAGLTAAESAAESTDAISGTEIDRAGQPDADVQSLSVEIEPAPETVRVLMEDGRIVEMAMDTYLKGVVPSEMGFVFRRGFEALKAQAIASRTYASTRCLPASAGDPSRCEPGIDANVDTSTRTQVWRPVHYDITDAAVEATSGQVARVEGRIINALFFARTTLATLDSEDSACCGARTWSYLRSTASPEAYDLRRGHGAGLSQEGAATLADWGATAEEIVEHYYAGASVDISDPPRLYAAEISPRQARRTEKIAFRVFYADADGDAPQLHNLIIDDIPFLMQGPEAEDHDYRLGALYQFTSTLDVGEHEIAFYFGDGKTDPIRLDAGTVVVDELRFGAASAPSSDPGDEVEDLAGFARSSEGTDDILAGEMSIGMNALRRAPDDSSLDDDRVGAFSSGGFSPDNQRPELLLEGPSLEADFPFMAVGARWDGRRLEDEHVDIEIRTSADGTIWSEWTTMLDMEEETRSFSDIGNSEGIGDTSSGHVEEDGHWTRLVIARGRYLQARARISAPPGVTLIASPIRELELYYLNSDAGPSAPVQPLRSMAVDQSSIVSRAEWGADESKRFDEDGDEIWPPFYTDPRAQIVHHTVTTNDPADPAAVVRSIYHYHAVTRGWGDIGYNFLIDHHGNVYEGRFGGERGGRITQGGHARQYNSNSIGVSLLGTFTEEDARPKTAALDALVELLAIKGSVYEIDPMAPVRLAGTNFAHSLMGHRDALPGHTACPGLGVHSQLSAIRTGVRARMAELGMGGGPIDPTPDPTPEPSPDPEPTTPAPPIEGCTNLVSGGDFESPDPKWMRNRAFYTEWDVYRGRRSLFIGLRDEDEDRAQSFASALQNIRVPENIDRAELRFAARTRGDANDIRFVRLIDAQGQTIPMDNAILPSQSGWSSYTYDLGPALQSLGGQEIRLYFGVINNGDGQRAYARLDDVALLACDSSGPGAQTSAVPPASETPIPEPSPTTPATATEDSVDYPEPQNTPTKAPTIEPEPSLGACDPLWVEGFENQDLGTWQLSGNHPINLLDSDSETEPKAFTGEGALSLGLSDPAQDQFGYAAAAHTLSIPRSTRPITLSMRLAWTDRAPEDAVLIELRKPELGKRQVLLSQQLGVGAESDDLARDLDWMKINLQVPEAWQGSESELYLAVMGRGQLENPGGITRMLVDDMALEYCRQPLQSWLPMVIKAQDF